MKGVEASCFKELRSYNGVDLGSYKKACPAREFNRNDDKWYACMDEAKIKFMAPQLRTLLARIFAHNNPSNPLDLWLKYKDDLSEDYRYKYPENIDFAEKLTYTEFVKSLIQEGKTLKDFPDLPAVESLDINNEINTQRELEFAHDKFQSLNIDQKRIVNEILKLVNIPIMEINDDNQHNINENNTVYQENSNVIFVDGPGGTGKTTVYETVNHFLRGHTKKVENMAFAGLAAMLLPLGRTLHNRFGLPVPLYSNSNSSINRNRKNGRNYQKQKFLLLMKAPWFQNMLLK